MEAKGDHSRQVVGGFRDRLLAEHLGATPETVAARIAETRSLITTVEHLRGGSRSLELLEAVIPDLANEFVLDHPIVDPEKSVSMEQMADRQGTVRRNAR